MKERPILMSAPMVRATIRPEKPKTQTRRGVMMRICGGKKIPVPTDWTEEEVLSRVKCPFGVAGDRLWVRESIECANGEALGYPADGTWLPNTPWKWKKQRLPSIHMPRWASRILLEIIEIRVERLQDIIKEDVIAEGITERNGYPIEEVFAGWHEPYAELWENINGVGSWMANPWVWVITFKRIK